ncbi:MAG: hypothetical protein NWS71_08815, partial [Opitutales bacterium]|nr:hypothetical protein [Opitutales bacterium]
MKLSTYSYILPVLACLSALNVHAANRTWDGSTDNDFSTASNWDTFPSGTHSAVMEGDAGDSLTVLSGGKSHSMNAINVRGGHTFTIDNATGTLTGTGNLNLGRGLAGNGNEINHSAGAFNIGGLDMGGNTIGGTSSYNLSGTASLSIAGGSGRDFDIGGDVAAGDFATTFAITGDSATVTVTGAPIVLRSSAIMSFTLGATGIDAIDTTGTLTISSGADLTIIGSAYSGALGEITLFEAATMTGSFASGDITVTGLGTEGVDWTLTQNAGSSGDIVLTIIPEPGAF